MNDLHGRVAAGILAAAVLAACGGDGKGTAPVAASTTAPPVVSTITSLPSATAGAQATTTVATGTGTGPGSGAPAAPGSTSPAKPGTTAAPGTSAKPTTGAPMADHGLNLGARLDKTCVTPNSMLTLTLKGRPGMHVIFNTTYKDGKDGDLHGGKETHGKIDAQGAYSATFLVKASAPAGDATLYVAAVDHIGTGHDDLPFRVALTC